jgi:two-component system LytT family response regulator
MSKTGDNRIAIQTVTGIKILKQEDILLFEYPKNERNWRIRFCNNQYQSLRVGITSKNILTLCTDFVQINQNCIINIIYLSAIENKTLKCEFYAHPEFDYTDIIQEITPSYYKKIKDSLNIL